MSMSIAQPFWGTAAAAILLIAGVLGMSRAFRQRSWRWRSGMMLPLLAACFAALALAGISIGRTPDVVILLDVSLSTRNSPWRDPAWVQALAEKRLGARRHVTVVAFASGQQIVFDGTTGGTWP